MKQIRISHRKCGHQFKPKAPRSLSEGLPATGWREGGQEQSRPCDQEKLCRPPTQPAAGNVSAKGEEVEHKTSKAGKHMSSLARMTTYPQAHICTYTEILTPTHSMNMGTKYSIYANLGMGRHVHFEMCPRTHTMCTKCTQTQHTILAHISPSHRVCTHTCTQAHTHTHNDAWTFLSLAKPQTVENQAEVE